MASVDERDKELRRYFDALLAAPLLPFDDELHSRLPDRSGIYVIYGRDGSAFWPLHAGRTGAGGLRQRIYQNHLMGEQAGNLRAKLVREGQCADLAAAKTWIRRNCLVRFLVVEDQTLLPWVEHYMLALLRPKYCS